MHSILGIVLIVLLFGNVQSDECAAAGKRVEAIMKSLLFINDRYQTFNSPSDLKPFCADAVSLLKESKKFKQIPGCLSPVSNTALSTIMPKFRQFQKSRCKEPVDNTIELLNCAVNENKKQIRRCFVDYSKIIQYTANEVQDTDEILSLLCCNYHRVLTCLGSLKDCAGAQRKGISNSGRFAYQTAEGFLSELFGLMCAKHTKEECVANGVIKKLDNIKYKSSSDEFLIVPALRIAHRLSQE